MRNAKQLCKDHNLYSYQAIKGAEMMAQAITDDVLLILQTASVRPLHERVAAYFGIKPQTARDINDNDEHLRSEHLYQLP